MHGEALAAAAGPAANGAAAKAAPRRERKSGGGGGGGGDTLASPLQGNVWKVLVEQGAEVEEGALVCIIEAMKMENEIFAHKAGTIAELAVQEGGAVKSGDTDRRHQVARVTDLDGAIHELADWLRIPSVSTAGGNPAALREAAEWALRQILAAGGTRRAGRDEGDHPRSSSAS